MNQQKRGFVRTQRTPPRSAPFYKRLVLPTLDYCSAVWDPTAVTLSNQLESLFRGLWPGL